VLTALDAVVLLRLCERLRLKQLVFIQNSDSSVAIAERMYVLDAKQITSKGNEMKQITIQDIENHKSISEQELKKDLEKLRSFDATTNTRSFYGNKFLYHFQLKNLMRCRRGSSDTIYDMYENPVKWTKLLESTEKRNRKGATMAGNIFECFRINHGSVVMFKATTAKYLYAKYGATRVLDPTAGWGGRMLGAWALGIDYTGIDTNTNMKPAYDSMIDFTGADNLRMIWANALDVDFSALDYDFVLTSTPYVNLEVYEHMTPWASDTEFYTQFLIPLWRKCLDHIRPGGHVCFNISPKMYEQALLNGLEPCDLEENLLQQLGQQMTKKKQDKIYIWRRR
jgi:hypothetical protein